MFVNQTVVPNQADAAYAAGDRIGTKILALDQMGGAISGSVLVDVVTVRWTGTGKNLRLWFLNGLPANLPADNAALTFDATDVELVAGVIAVAAPDTNSKVKTLTNVGLILPFNSISGAMYLVLQADEAVTFGAGTEITSITVSGAVG